MNEFSFDNKTSIIKFNEERPNIYIEIHNFWMDLDFNYSVRAIPEFYIDEGPGQIKFHYNNISIGLEVTVLDGFFQYLIYEVHADYDNGETYFNGKGDLSYILSRTAQITDNLLRQNANKTLEVIWLK